MILLELFSGTHSVGKIAQKLGYEVLSLDIDGRADITCDIMDWDYTVYPVRYFDIIWASPECKIFSHLQYTQIGRKWKDKNELQEARDQNSIYIQRTIEIIDYFNPAYYFIENPLQSKIWDYVDSEYKDKFVIVDYCFFGYRYKKPTKILTNKQLENKRCSCKKHDMRIGVYSGKMENAIVKKKDNTTLDERYSMPPKLLEYLIK